MGSCPSSKSHPHKFIGGLEPLALARLDGKADQRSSSGRPESEPRARAVLTLESIALRHHIAVLESSRTRRPCFRRLDLVVALVAAMA